MDSPPNVETLGYSRQSLRDRGEKGSMVLCYFCPTPVRSLICFPTTGGHDNIPRHGFGSRQNRSSSNPEKLDSPERTAPEGRSLSRAGTLDRCHSIEERWP